MGTEPDHGEVEGDVTEDPGSSIRYVSTGHRIAKAKQIAAIPGAPNEYPEAPTNWYQKRKSSGHGPQKHGEIKCKQPHCKYNLY
eukprot:2756894-Rhodomonas_salina.2